MGLDMYLNKYPKLGLPISMVSNIENLFEWEERDTKYADTPFSEWCYTSENDLPVKEIIDVCRGFYHESYYAWDESHRYPYKMIHDNIAYWRKANAIHGWIERHIDSEELKNCDDYKITKDMIVDLLLDCSFVLDNTKLVEGKVTNGYRCTDNGFEPIIEDGLVVEDSTACEDVLPTESGFFFGSTEYTQWYLDDIKYTKSVCEKILDEVDFDRYELYYHASW